MTSPAELPPDPRLCGKTSHYNRSEIVDLLAALYDFLPQFSSGSVHRAPPDGWSCITAEILEKRGIHKTPKAVELLRHLPYIDGDHPWIAPEAFPCDYRILGSQASARNTPGWVQDVQQDSGNVTAPDGSPAGVEKWPPSVIQLTAGTDREGSCYMLDTMDGTVTKYCVVGYLYEPTYDKGDPRAWRDRLCGEDTVTVADQVEKWRRAYHELRYLGVPDIGDGNGYPSLYFRGEEDGPDSYDWKETEVRVCLYPNTVTHSLELTCFLGVAVNLSQSWLARSLR